MKSSDFQLSGSQKLLSAKWFFSGENPITLFFFDNDKVTTRLDFDKTTVKPLEPVLAEVVPKSKDTLSLLLKGTPMEEDEEEVRMTVIAKFFLLTFLLVSLLSSFSLL